VSRIIQATSGIDTSVDPAVYDAWLNDVRTWLPAFLEPSANEQSDPVADVQELMRLDPEDLRRVQAVHLCLSDQVRALVATLPAGLRRPLTSSIRPREASQAVRGPIDWGATIRLRSASGADPTLFVTRPARRIFDTPENQTLAWALRRLGIAVRAARASAQETPDDFEASGWFGELHRLEAALRMARRTEWLREVEPKRPTAFARQRLATARTFFYRHAVGGVVGRLLEDERSDPLSIAEMISSRYFVPARNWKLFEIWVALRLAREFDDPRYSDGMRKVRLMKGAGGVSDYARFRLHDGDEVRLIYQGWPSDPGPSVRRTTAKRHNFRPGGTIPDLMIVRTGAKPDVLVLELKATTEPGYLGEGLSQLLGYLSERPALFGRRPAGWLVAPTSGTFDDAPALEGEPLWVVGADYAPEAVAARIASQ